MHTADLRARLGELLDRADGRDDARHAARLVAGVMLDALDRLEAGGVFADEEFVRVLLTQLARRSLDAVGERPAADVALAWRVLREHRLDAGGGATRVASAAANAVVNHDLPLAVVSTCTLLGRAPGALERADSEAFVAVVTEHVERLMEADPGGRVRLPVDGSWACVGRLWVVRGQPVAARERRDAIDRNAGLLGWNLLMAAGPEPSADGGPAETGAPASRP
jgi:hypothetical protein